LRYRTHNAAHSFNLYKRKLVFYFAKKMKKEKVNFRIQAARSIVLTTATGLEHGSP